MYFNANDANLVYFMKNLIEQAEIGFSFLCCEEKVWNNDTDYQLAFNKRSLGKSSTLSLEIQLIKTHNIAQDNKVYSLIAKV